MTEIEIYQKYLKPYNQYFDFIKIETGSVSRGVADVYYISKTHRAVNGWIELKVAKQSKGKIKVRYEPGQIDFLKRHVDRGLRAFVLIYYNEYFFMTTAFKKEFICSNDLVRLSVYCEHEKDLKKVDSEFIKLLHI